MDNKIHGLIRLKRLFIRLLIFVVAKSEFVASTLRKSIQQLLVLKFISSIRSCNVKTGNSDFLSRAKTS